jgi:hypothetical protein
MPHAPRWSAALMILSALAISACARSEAFDSEAASDEGPAKVEAIKGTDLARVVLTPQAARRLGIRTAPVRPEHGETSIPYSALLYDAEGRAFTYTSPARLTYVRRPLTIDRITRRAVLLKAGPRPGTPVVIVGAAELLGTEYGVEE